MSLLKASKIGATYDPIQQQLNLSAEVELNRVTYGIVFKTVNWVGTYKFNLVGFQTGPQPEETVNILRSVRKPDNPLFLKHIVVCSQDFPEGEVIDVNWLGFGEVRDVNTRKAATSLEPAAIQTMPVIIPMKVLDKENFTIQTRVEDSVTLEPFDERYVQLLNAEISHGNIIWTFLALTTGNTNIRVVSDLAPNKLGYDVTYMVEIILPFGPGPVIKLDEKKEGGLILSYLGKVTEIQTQVLKKYPDATLHSVKAYTHNTRTGVDNIGSLIEYIVTFRLPTEQKFLNVESFGEYIHETIVPISIGLPDLPSPIAFQAEEALKMLRERLHEVDVHFTEVKLNMTAATGDPHIPATPVYTFRLVDGSEEQVQQLLGGETKP